MADEGLASRLVKEDMKCNDPKRTPGHDTKSHVVKACELGKRWDYNKKFGILHLSRG